MRLLLFCLFNQLALSVLCLRNVTVDDNDPSIQYTQGWGQATPTDLDHGGGHTLTTNTSAQALFNFTGVAVYFMSPLWPYAVSTAITLDSRPTVIVDLTDHNTPDTGGGVETVQSDVVWSAVNLPNTTHTLRISIGRGQQNAIVDGIIYTVLDPGESLSIGSSSDDSGDGHQVIIIVLAVLVGILALVLLVLLLWLCLRRRDPAPIRARRSSIQSSVKWGGGARGDDASVAERDPIDSPRIPPTAPHTPPPPSRPDSNYQSRPDSNYQPGHPGEPGTPVWSTLSVGGPGVQNMTGVGASARNSHAISYHHGDPRRSAGHFGASQGDLADAYDPGPYTNPNRNPNYPNI